MLIDMWYGDKIKDATKIDIFFNDCDCVYRGNVYSNNKCIGDYEANSTQEIEDAFKHLIFNWN